MRRQVLFTGALLILFCIPALCHGSDIEARVKVLEDTLKKQGETIQEQQSLIRELRSELDAARKKSGPTVARTAATEPESAEKMTAERDSSEGKGWKLTGLFGSSSLSNPNISLVLNTFGYHSNLKRDALAKRGIPGYTTTGLSNTKGFNIDSAELAFFAPVDPYFNLYATIPFTEDGVELEEAYFVTTFLPYGFQAKGGKFKSGFGRLNSQHKHAWDFIDLPLPYRAFIDGEGITEKGLQITWLPPLPFYSLIGVEALQGENAMLFGSDAHVGPHAFTAFAKFSFDMGENSTILFGPSVITGKTRTDTIADNSVFQGSSTLFDWEMTYKWRPSKKRSLVIQSEYMYRTQHGELTDNSSGMANSLRRGQDGLYMQAVYQLGLWRLGARFDALNLLAREYSLSGAQTEFGSRPWRASAALDLNPTEFSRIRLQYNYDKSAGRERANNEIFLQLILAIGAHSAHPF
jgi:hypothetical protein